MRPTFALGGLALAVLVAGSGLALALRDDAPPTVQVRLAAAQRGQVTATVSAAGNTVDGSRRDLAFGSSGTLTKVYVKVGTKVTKGQVLARVDGRSAREAYTAAKADLAAAEEALEDAQEKAASPTTAASPAACTPSGNGATPATSATGAATPTGGAPAGSATPKGSATSTRGATSTGAATPAGRATSTATPTGRPSGGAVGGNGASGNGANGALGPTAPSTQGVSLSNGSPATSSTPRPTSTPTSVPTDPGPTDPGPEPQPTVTVTVTATVTTTVTATPTGGAPQGTPGGGSDQSGSRPTSDATPSTTRSGKPSTSAKPSASGRPTSSGKPSAGASTRPTSGAARPNAQSSCNRGTGSAGQGQSPAQNQGQGQGGVSEEQAGANVDRAQAALEQAADAVRATRIVAPAAGTVLSLAGAVGDQAGTGTFVSLGDLNELQVQAMVTESDVNRLKLGQKARITLATRNGRQYEGTITAIAPTATVSGQLVRYSVTLAFDEPPTGLMLGQTASVTVTTDTAADAIYVPASAVRSRSDGTQVVTVRAGGRDSAKVVRTGVRGDQYVEVTSGLQESDEVVMSGATNGEFPDASWPGACPMDRPGTSSPAGSRAGPHVARAAPARRAPRRRHPAPPVGAANAPGAWWASRWVWRACAWLSGFSGCSQQTFSRRAAPPPGPRPPARWSPGW